MKVFSLRRWLRFIALALVMILGIVVMEDLKNQQQQKVIEEGKWYLQYLDDSLTNEQNQHLKRWLKERQTPKTIGEKSLYGMRLKNIQIIDNPQKREAVVIETLKKARDHIHMEYFIIRNDEIGNRIKDILIEKRKNGVEVRLIYDWFGSMSLDSGYVKELRKAGVEVIEFSPLIDSLFRFCTNHRNHRKILLVDSHIAIVGGSNIGDEYFGERTEIGKWKDLDILIEGNLVKSLQAIFLKDWYITKKEAIIDEKYYIQTGERGDISAEIITGGLNSHDNNIEVLYFSILQSAKENIRITTPYLIPTPELMSAFKDAVLRGVKVEIIIPRVSDNKAAQYATESYANELIDMGVEIYQYNDGFLHSKMMIKDDSVALVGTANLDHRGLKLDYEVIAIIYDKDMAKELEVVFNEDLKRSKKIIFMEKSGFTRKFGKVLIELTKGIL